LFYSITNSDTTADETSQESADDGRSLVLKPVLIVGESDLQEFHCQLAKRMPLSTFIAGLISYVLAGKQVRFEPPLRQLIEPFRTR
jgi:hypothetical protein